MKDGERELKGCGKCFTEASKQQQTNAIISHRWRMGRESWRAEENVLLKHPNNSKLMQSFLTGEGWGERAEGLRKMFSWSIQMTVNWCDHFSLVKDGESWMVPGNVLLQRPNNNKLMRSFLAHEGWGETAESRRKMFHCGVQTTIN